jgi:hypothetical protein
MSDLFSQPAPGVLTVLLETAAAAIAFVLPFYLIRPADVVRRKCARTAILLAAVPVLVGAMALGSVLMPDHGRGPVIRDGVDTGERINYEWTTGEMLARCGIIFAPGALALASLGALAAYWGREQPRT